MTRVGFFSGSFDPMTNGHLDVIEHAAALCDRLVIGVGSNPNKAGLFTMKSKGSSILLQLRRHKLWGIVLRQ